MTVDRSFPLLFLSLLMALTTACPNGYFRHDTSCYVIPKQEATWPEAKVYCQSMGAELAIIETAEEQNMLAAHLRTNRAAYDTPYFWVDGADFFEEGQWVWTRVREPIGPAFWGPGEPDNGQGGKQQHCVDLDGDFDYKWDDGHCHARINFICELPNEDIPVVG